MSSPHQSDLPSDPPSASWNELSHTQTCPWNRSSIIREIRCIGEHTESTWMGPQQRRTTSSDGDNDDYDGTHILVDHLDTATECQIIERIWAEPGAYPGDDDDYNDMPLLMDPVDFATDNQAIENARAEPNISTPTKPPLLSPVAVSLPQPEEQEEGITARHKRTLVSYDCALGYCNGKDRNK